MPETCENSKWIIPTKHDHVRVPYGASLLHTLGQQNQEMEADNSLKLLPTKVKLSLKSK
jgi:hypothetical protein